MLGQHMFMRCWNEQNNAGTWTAAVTDGVADKSIIRSEIEPRCNIDEIFAQKNMLQRSSNNVLRIYPLSNGSVVVSRTFWENDRITEASGRKGAYTISFIMTANDVNEYCKDFSGAFDESCFETYNSVVRRMQAANSRRVTIDPGFDIFKHNYVENDYSIFESAGFNRETFIQLMEGLYSSIEQNEKLAVVLPQRVRDSWLENGDNTSERLMMAILSLLPTGTRQKVGMVSHWGCSLRDDMLRGIQLVFVHPSSNEDMSELKRSGAKILDLSSGNEKTNIPSNAPRYFSFMWDSLSNRKALVEVWRFAMDNCGNVIKRLPGSAVALESVFAIKRASDNGYKDARSCRDAYVAASGIFAGAGKVLPFIEEAVTAALVTIMQSKISIDHELESSIVRFVVQDQGETDHQVPEYRLLFAKIDSGMASNATINAMVHEVEKPDRNVDEYFINFLQHRKDISVDSINAEMVSFSSGLFDVLSGMKDSSHTELQSVVLTVLNTWAPKLEAASKWDALSPIAVIYADYLKTRGNNADAVINCYKMLFGASISAKEEFRNRCETELTKEERRIYNNLELTTEQGQTRLSLFCQALMEVFPLADDVPDNIRERAYQRLFRLSGVGRMGVQPELQTAFCGQLYKIIQTAGLAGTENLLFESQYIAVNDMRSAPAIWSSEGIRTSVITFESALLDVSEDYWPSPKRLAFILDSLGALDGSACQLVTQYLQHIPVAFRPGVYEVIRDRGMIGNLYVYTFLDTAAGTFKAELDPYVDQSHGARLKMLVEAQFSAGSAYNGERLKEAFKTWYKGEFNKLFAENSEFLQRLAIVNNEYAELDMIRYDYNGLKAEAISILNRNAQTVLSQITKSQVAELPKKAIATIAQILSMQVDPTAISITPAVQTVSKLDSMDERRLVRDLDDFSATYECTTQKSIVIDRLDYYIRHYRASHEGITLAWQYELFRSLLFDSDQPFTYNMTVGEMDATYSRMDDSSRASLLLDMMASLDFPHSNNRRRVYRESVTELGRIAVKNPDVFRDSDIRNKLLRLRYLSSDEKKYLNRRLQRSGVSLDPSHDEWDGFDGRIILFCVLGAIVSLVVFAGILLILHFANEFGTLVAILIGLLIAVLIFFVFLLLHRNSQVSTRTSQWGYF